MTENSLEELMRGLKDTPEQEAPHELTETNVEAACLRSELMQARERNNSLAIIVEQTTLEKHMLASILEEVLQQLQQSNVAIEQERESEVAFRTAYLKQLDALTYCVREQDGKIKALKAMNESVLRLNIQLCEKVSDGHKMTARQNQSEFAHTGYEHILPSINETSDSDEKKFSGPMNEEVTILNELADAEPDIPNLLNDEKFPLDEVLAKVRFRSSDIFGVFHRSAQTREVLSVVESKSVVALQKVSGAQTLLKYLK